MNQWDLDNITIIYINSDHTWDPVCIDNDIKGQVIYPDEGDADDDLYYFLRRISTYSPDLDLEIYERDRVDMLSWIDNSLHVYPISTKTFKKP